MHDAIAIAVPFLRVLCLPKNGGMLHPIARAPGLLPQARKRLRQESSAIVHGVMVHGVMVHDVMVPDVMVHDFDAPEIEEEALLAHLGGTVS